jgi:hypothetical protein
MSTFLSGKRTFKKISHSYSVGSGIWMALFGCFWDARGQKADKIDVKWDELKALFCH